MVGKGVMAEEFEGPTNARHGANQQQQHGRQRGRQQGPKGIGASLWTLPWFHGHLDQKAAESLLLENGADDGLFLVRIPPTRSAFVISVSHRGRLQHFLVNRNKDRHLTLPECPG